MLGTVVNFLAIIIGSFIGLIMKNGISDKVSKSVMNGLALCVLFIGILNIIDTHGKLQSSSVMVIIVSIVIGVIIGEKIDIDKRLEIFGAKLEKKISKDKGKGMLAEGFITSSLIFCVGAMSIVGALESGLLKSYNTLYAKSVLDAITAIIFSSSMGIGVMLSSITVLLYQGLITIAAGALKGILIESVITNITAIGGILIIGLALNMLKVTKIKIANFIPAIFLPIIYQVVLNLIK